MDSNKSSAFIKVKSFYFLCFNLLDGRFLHLSKIYTVFINLLKS